MQPEADSPSKIKKESVDCRNREENLNEVSREWVACYSPYAVDRTCVLDDSTESRTLYESIKKWLQPLRNRLSRRSQ